MTTFWIVYAAFSVAALVIAGLAGWEAGELVGEWVCGEHDDV